MKNETILKPLFISLYEKLKDKDFVIDKTGVQCVEEIDYHLCGLSSQQPLLDFGGFRKTNEDYCKKELDWYLSKDLSIIGHVDNVKIWNEVATKDDKKEINSNYGWCIFSDENFNQYDNCKNTLIKDKLSRRACMIYTRPSMQIDYNRNGMSDFICTHLVGCLIRDDALIYTVKQRSSDIIYGFFNDFFWHCWVYNKLYSELKETYHNLEIGHISFNFDSVHVYSRHFDMLTNIVENYYKYTI